MEGLLCAFSWMMILDDGFISEGNEEGGEGGTYCITLEGEMNDLSPIFPRKVSRIEKARGERSMYWSDWFGSASLVPRTRAFRKFASCLSCTVSSF